VLKEIRKCRRTTFLWGVLPGPAKYGSLTKKNRHFGTSHRPYPTCALCSFLFQIIFVCCHPSRKFSYNFCQPTHCHTVSFS
jgi:hypothetical protein